MRSAIEAAEWPGIYVGGHVAGCAALPALGWSVAAQPVVVIAERLAANRGEFLPLGWLLGDLSRADPRVSRQLFRAARHGQIMVADDDVVAVPPATSDEWLPAKAKILALIPRTGAIAYEAIRNRARLSEISLKTILQVLSDSRAIEADTAVGAEWEALRFRKAATAAS
jgi:hypothetical protein